MAVLGFVCVVVATIAWGEEGFGAAPVLLLAAGLSTFAIEGLYWAQVCGELDAGDPISPETAARRQWGLLATMLLLQAGEVACLLAVLGLTVLDVGGVVKDPVRIMMASLAGTQATLRTMWPIVGLGAWACARSSPGPLVAVPPELV